MRRVIPLIGVLCLAFPLIGCSGSDVDPAEVHAAEKAEPVTKAPAVEAPAPQVGDTKSALARSAKRWEMIAAEDWIQAYDYLAPARRKQETLAQYLSNKEDHEYRNPSKPHLIGTDGDFAYIEFSVVWTPHHPILNTVDIGPESYTQTLNMIESWQWVDGEWYWIHVARQNEFLAAHPQFKK